MAKHFYFKCHEHQPYYYNCQLVRLRIFFQTFKSLANPLESAKQLSVCLVCIRIIYNNFQKLYFHSIEYCEGENPGKLIVFCLSRSEFISNMFLGAGISVGGLYIPLVIYHDLNWNVGKVKNT